MQRFAAIMVHYGEVTEGVDRCWCRARLSLLASIEWSVLDTAQNGRGAPQHGSGCAEHDGNKMLNTFILPLACVWNSFEEQRDHNRQSRCSASSSPRTVFSLNNYHTDGYVHKHCKFPALCAGDSTTTYCYTGCSKLHISLKSRYPTRHSQNTRSNDSVTFT